MNTITSNTECRYIQPLPNGGAKKNEIEFDLVNVGILIVGFLMWLAFLNKEHFFFGTFIAVLFTAAVHVIYENNKLYRQEQELLDFYAEIKFPIIVWSEFDGDTNVLAMANYHRDLLSRSENTLYQSGKLTVHEIYAHDPRCAICESWEEFLMRREKERIELMNKYAKTVYGTDESWMKTILLNQKV